MADGKLPKVVLIGFNKCATRSFARLFQAAGHKALHHKLRRSLRRSQTMARLMRENLTAGRKIFAGAEDYVFFSDLIYVTPDLAYEGNSDFRQMLADYPDTILVLNLRDREAWIKSRTRHGHGEFIQRYQAALGLADAAAVQDHWRQAWDAHIAAVRAFMADYPDQLIEFDIDSDPITDLTTRLSDYRLNPADWGDSGRSRGRKQTGLLAGLRRFWAHVKHRPTV